MGRLLGGRGWDVYFVWLLCYLVVLVLADFGGLFGQFAVNLPWRKTTDDKSRLVCVE